MSSGITNAAASSSTSVPEINAPLRNEASPKPEGSSGSSRECPIPELFDPFKNGIPKRDGDPYDYFLKPMLEKDTIQCDAWKDEVQNILIFAGLFSAVVTAFIIESYQRLQPDPNDTIVGLLVHIAERLDSMPTNKTSPASSTISSTTFSPSRSDININVFWFTSLVLSLTVALIGIITLQWLREHQRYDNNLSPKETFAILNLRTQSLKRWYVPQIFAGLPLLLQGALILFFAGIIEFLFALRLEVAVPDPFRLAVNEEIPLPCPYKSPQSIISRRIGTVSPAIFRSCASIIAGMYGCLTAATLFVKQLMGHRAPIFRSNPNRFRAMVAEPPSKKIERLWQASGDWTSVDRLWLEMRTSYTVLLQTGQTREDGGLTQSN
ncbi:hypothetical protein D9619_004714 [Psilocybe cf. subviscida]|uniref:DUF6535 domain-containing protein n=1 Tax=Psilocybe cf. subviscida TaxID=2480587 RepID=A0A8H5F8N6_9AGAR|nr:hypothetical protein D9619_004714 [Psilocybe cf. subviscida]